MKDGESVKRKLILLLALGLVVISLFLTKKNNAVDSFSTQPLATEARDETNNPIIVDNDIEDSISDTNNTSLDNNIPDNNIDYLKDTTYEDENGKLIVKNTEDILVLVNKKRNLSSDYKPEDLVIPSVRFPFKEILEKKYLRKEAADALEELFIQAEKEDIILYAVSGYRSYNTQKMLFDNKERKVGFEKANLLVAYPGQSEHQTGLAMDVSSESVKFTLEENFGQAVEGKWLKDNAHKFGFIIRFQKETTDITGYSYEPWHIRYVGQEIAKEIYEKNITLEEFLGDI